MKAVLRCIAVAVIFLSFAVVSFARTNIRRHEGGVPNEFVVLLSNDTPTQSVVGLARSLTGTYGLHL